MTGRVSRREVADEDLVGFSSGRMQGNSGPSVDRLFRYYLHSFPLERVKKRDARPEGPNRNDLAPREHAQAATLISVISIKRTSVREKGTGDGTNLASRSIDGLGGVGVHHVR